MSATWPKQAEDFELDDDDDDDNDDDDNDDSESMDRDQTVDCKSICNVNSIESTIKSTIKSSQWMVYGMMLVEPENHHCHISFESVLSFLYDDLIRQKDEKLPTKTDHLLIMFQNNMKKNEDSLLEIPVRDFIQSRSVFVSVLQKHPHIYLYIVGHCLYILHC